jgi:hypothetical protein
MVEVKGERGPEGPKKGADASREKTSVTLEKGDDDITPTEGMPIPVVEVPPEVPGSPVPAEGPASPAGPGAAEAPAPPGTPDPPDAKS